MRLLHNNKFLVTDHTDEGIGTFYVAVGIEDDFALQPIELADGKNTHF